MVVYHYVYRVKKTTKLILVSLLAIISLLSFIRFAKITNVGARQENQVKASSGSLQSRRQNYDHLHPVTKLLLENPDKQVLYVDFAGNPVNHGLGSLVVLLLFFYGYFQREILILNEAYVPQYRFNETTGPFSGYFHSAFPVLENRDELELIQGQLLNETTINITWDAELVRSDNRQPTRRIAHVTFGDIDYAQFLKRATKEVCTDDQLNDICHLPQVEPVFCKLFAFQPNIEKSIQEHFQNTFPDLNFDNSVTFHIRRGDKVNDEDTLHSASEYVQFFLTRLPSEASNIKHCFLASDDPSVKTEMEAALKGHNVTCKLYSNLNNNDDNNSVSGVASDMQSRKSISRTMDFMIELYAMVHSTYFFGRNKSNVWKLAVMFRGCRRSTNNTNDVDDGSVLENNFHSYEILDARFSLFHLWGLKR